MLRGMFVTAGCIAAVMAGIKDHRLLRSAGLAGSCSIVQQLADGSVVDACSAGRLEGQPDLSRRDCTDLGLHGKLEYWHCPAGTQAP